MENTIQTQNGSTLDAESLLALSLVLKDVSHTVGSMQTIVFLLLRYVRIGLSIANSLVDMVAPAA